MQYNNRIKGGRKKLGWRSLCGRWVSLVPISIKNSNTFFVGFIVGAVLGFLGYFLQLEPGSKPIVDAFLNALVFALVLGVLIGIGFLGKARKTRADAVPLSDETDYCNYKGVE
ncbi:cbb3-type cytochrome c oxidase subunit I [Pseudoalteromonas ruthenica]|uniref:cbb3-type cytochrome c oxidase subunit I n=1 Tax=Pseudoalteromonas ruthenica TaxID=151081 RepID=UPI00110B9BA9|nr:cbb3-type cytochrome c oxidase subunit I [Pseudoalteromonas ruthenica]TMO49877.1 hypothetical protein CWC24_00195 [Pseudoalteromonas ruthenica]TMO50555.1 hypothetical protein CWC23_10675 [Pseudoalteromonas ruthenica]